MSVVKRFFDEKLEEILEEHKDDKDFHKELARVLRSYNFVTYRHKFNPRFLRNLNSDAKTIIDVGVDSCGTPELYKAFEHEKIVLIEPNEEMLLECVKNFPEYSFDCFMYAAGSEEATLELNMVGTTGQYSLKERVERDRYEDKGSMTVTVKPLDRIIKSGQYETPFGLKVDIEGYELEMLKGATRTLKDCAFVVVEVCVKKFYEDGYKFSDVIGFMAEQGFQLYDILNVEEYAPNTLDVVFLKEDHIKFNRK